MNVLGNIDPIDVIREELWSHRHNFSVDEVDEITLLSIEEVRQLPKDILKADDWWWLRSPGNRQDYVASVDCIGSVRDFGIRVNYDYLGVRPVFRINNLKLPFGEKVYVEKTQCTVIGKGLILSDKIVCRHRFDTESNDWKTSELKRFIESKKFKTIINEGSG